MKANWARVAICVALLTQTAALAGCNSASRSAADIRLYCLRTAHKVFKEQPDQDAYKAMVQEYYLRCLEAKGVQDAPVKERT